jgi:hypothetical protein
MNTRKMWKLIFIAPFAIVGIAALVALAVAVGGEVVKLLWNWLLPPLFGFRQVTFWQAVGMLALCRILFGGHVYRSGHRRRTPEERERFRQGMRDRFGFGRGERPGGGTAPVSL